MMKTYAQKLRDPRWQRKRLEVMERAEFSCENCGDRESTLNVHHGYYTTGLEPWDYPSISLHCLCESCHKEADRIRRVIQKEAASLSIASQKTIIGFLRYLRLHKQEQQSEEVNRVLGDYTFEDESDLSELLDEELGASSTPTEERSRW